MERDFEYITSKANPLVMRTASLAERKYRKKERLFRFDGKKLLTEALSAHLPLVALLFRESESADLTALLRDFTVPADCRICILPDGLFDRLTEEKAPEGVIAVSEWLSAMHRPLTAEPLSAGATLLLESVRDPGNLGTVIRSARAFGVENLILTADCADIYNPRTIRAAMGTLFRQNIYITEDPIAAVAMLRERGRVFAAALEPHAARLGQVTLTTSDTLVVGNEGHGISAPLLAACTESLYIPMEEGVESLNAGVAASVLLWEAYRGR